MKKYEAEHVGIILKGTIIIAHDDSELDTTELVNDENELVDIFSLQNKNWKETNATPLNSSYSFEDIDFECDNKGIDNTSSTNVENIIPLSREDEFRKAKFLQCKYFFMERPFFLYRSRASISLTDLTNASIGAHSLYPIKDIIKGSEL